MAAVAYLSDGFTIGAFFEPLDFTKLHVCSVVGEEIIEIRLSRERQSDNVVIFGASY